MTDIAEVGEFGLIARLLSVAGTPPPPEGPGDDAALVGAPDGRLVATTDLLVEGTHFRRDWSSAYDIGRKAAAQNLADVAAMGARPTVLLIGLGAPADYPVDEFDAFAVGIRAECAAAGAALAGGDLVRAPQLVVSGTALGVLDGRAPVLRSGACPGDVVGVVGRLGWAAAGLRLLIAGETAGPLVDAHRRPEPPYAAGPTLAIAGATSMCDVSDGLVADLGHLADASGVTMEVALASLRSLGAPGVTDDDLLNGGEDHALAFTLPPGTAPPAEAVVIGRVTAGPPGVQVDGLPAANGGYRHFGGAESGLGGGAESGLGGGAESGLGGGAESGLGGGAESGLGGGAESGLGGGAESGLGGGAESGLGGGALSGRGSGAESTSAVEPNGELGA